MLLHAREGWSRVPFQTVSVPLEQGTHIKWRAFLFLLMLFVFLEVAVVMYVGLGTAGRVTAVPADAGVQQEDSVYDLRWNLGLIIGNGTNESSHSAFLFSNATITFETFAEHYRELCENYFIPRTINANQKFVGLFSKIAGRHFDDLYNLDNLSKKHTDKSGTYNESSQDNAHDTIAASNKLCPCVPDSLSGPINVSMDAPYIGELELAHPEIQNGGHWKPPDCTPRHRTAIIIPFRDREEHLRIVLSYLHPLLQRQMLYYTIFVVEQVYPAVFNKASIMNVGYREATLTDSFDCFIFHDVDMIPENDFNFYTCTAQPRHVGSHCDKFHYQVPYRNIFGGVTAFTSKQFMKVNGFSNEFYGWGGEDDDMFQRIKASGMQISRFPGNIARYTMIKHGSDAGNPYNSRSYVAWKSRPDHYRRDGLSQLRYYRRQMELRPLYTWYQVELPDPPAPPHSSIKKSDAAILEVPCPVLLFTIILFICLHVI